MIAQAGQFMLLQVFVCSSATVQSVAEDHDLLAPSLLAFDHLQVSGALDMTAGQLIYVFHEQQVPAAGVSPNALVVTTMQGQKRKPIFRPSRLLAAHARPQILLSGQSTAG